MHHYCSVAFAIIGEARRVDGRSCDGEVVSIPRPSRAGNQVTNGACGTATGGVSNKLQRKLADPE
jgi:hypothetical protein